MFSEIDAWLYKHIAGIKPLLPGFKEVLIKPAFLPHLNYVKAHTSGIFVEWNKDIIKVVSPVSGKLSVDGKIFDFKAGTVVYKRNERKLNYECSQRQIGANT